MAPPQLQKARQLIEAKRYDEARRILQGLGDNPTAQKWLAKLDQLSSRSKPKPVNRGLLIGLTVFLVTAVVIVVVLLLTLGPEGTVTSVAVPTIAQLPTLTSTNMPSETPTPTATFTPSPTLTETPTLTLTPTSTPSPTFTETPIPTFTPNLAATYAHQATSNAISNATATQAILVQAVALTQTQAALIPTPIPITGCWFDDVMAWTDNQIAQGYDLNSMLTDLTLNPSSEQALNYAEKLSEAQLNIELYPYPECVNDARGYLLRSLKEYERFFRAAAAGRRSEANQALELGIIAADQYLREISTVFQFQIQLD